MKAEINQRIAGLLENPEIEAIRVEARSQFSVYRDARDKDLAVQRKAFEDLGPGQVDEVGEPLRFQYTSDEDDVKNDELHAAFKSREKVWRDAIAVAQRENLEKKKGFVATLDKLIKEEENIGKAFNTFNELSEQWKQVGNVPGDQHQTLSDEWHRLRDSFFYNINIYKQLADHDLAVNLKMKEELIALAKGLVLVDDLKEKNLFARELQKKWLEIGPSPRDTYQELADTFYGLTRSALDKVKAHYDDIREGYKVHLDAKLAVIDKLRDILTRELDSPEVFTPAAEEVKGLQKEWKMAGFAGRADDQKAWNDFRSLCDLFFEKRDVAFADIRKDQKENRDKKRELVKQAIGFKENTDWKESSHQLIQLQKSWKEIGPSGREDQRLWREFRKACDAFFKGKKSHFAEQDKAYEGNLSAKTTLIKEINAYKLTGAHQDDLAALKVFSTRWNESGHVPRHAFDKVVDGYRTALDAKYDALGANRSERSVDAYKQRAESLVSGDGSEHSARKEERALRDKIERLQTHINQFENNMGFFTGKGAESMLADFNKKIEKERREIDEIKKKLGMLRNARQKAEAAAAPKED
jgi:hypothetical protein